MIIETDRIYEPIAWSNEDPYIRYDEVYRAIAEEGEIISIMRKDGKLHLVAVATDGTNTEMKNIRMLIQALPDEEGIVCTKYEPKEKE